MNNKSILVLGVAGAGVQNSIALGEKTFHVLHKRTGEWRPVKIEGGRSVPRGFGPWLAGYVADVWRDQPSPGYAERRKEISSTGTPVDWRFNDVIYSHGILFIYNAVTQQQYRIQTNQGDSEVLLIDGNEVYYRVNEPIYKALIGPDKIEQPTLLTEADFVPDIHWAFVTIRES